MQLLGARAWWAPAPLRRLHHRFGIREGASRAPIAVPAAANAPEAA
jgi:RND superfamily putative drug exporter